MAARAALVTGASSGIGLAIARMLGEEGYELTVVGRRPEKLEQAAEGLRAEGIELQAIAADVGSEDAVIDVVRAHQERFGRLEAWLTGARGRC